MKAKGKKPAGRLIVTDAIKRKGKNMVEKFLDGNPEAKCFFESRKGRKTAKAERSGITLNDEDAAIAKGMLARGDRQHDIAAWFGVNGGRIADIKTEKTFSHVAPVYDNLPPVGPYLSGRASNAAHETIAMVVKELRDLAQRLDQRLKET
ncbi:hypothetical protein [Aquicoccus porphyridii]|uniref:hypothetical protein n=1 Tax=Aquicoccus porphyridii TaxID=1852029 RepID=UPI001CAA85CA|nr:hypothetical protein [Aquicoccus porphyridii]